MARRRYIAWNGAMPTTAAIPSVTTGTVIKTMLQLKPTTPIAIIEWGYYFDIIPTAKVTVELCTTGTIGVAALTTYNAADLMKYDDSTGGASLASIAANASGFTSSSTEGSITAVRSIQQRSEWGQSYEKQFPLDREPGVQANDFLRIRVTTATALNMLCYVAWEE